MSDVLLELNESTSFTGGMTGCLSCSIDIFTVDSAKRLAAGLHVRCPSEPACLPDCPSEHFVQRSHCFVTVFAPYVLSLHMRNI